MAGERPFMASTTAPLWVALNPLIWIFWLLDFLLYILLPFPFVGPILTIVKLCRRGKSSSHETDNQLKIRCNEEIDGVANLRTTPTQGMNTAFELIQDSCMKHQNLKAMGTRTFLGWHKPGKFPLKIFGDTKWITYGQLKQQYEAFGRGLLSLGMEPLSKEASSAVADRFEQIPGPNCMLIFEETCANWMTAALGAMSQSIVVATSYSTLGMSAVGEALNETRSPVILCNYKDVAKVATLQENCPHLKSIIYTRNYVEENEPNLNPDDFGGLRVLSFDEVVTLGNVVTVGNDASPAPAINPPAPEQLAVIMYTSGSTGKPKGVVLKHSSIAGALAGLYGYLTGFLNSSASTEAEQEVYLAYLPAAHILEFAAELSVLTLGAAVGYSDPKTISSKGAVRKMPDGSLNGEPTGYGNHPPGGIQEFAPTLMAAVPKIWDILKKGVEATIGGKSGVVQALFLAAFAGRSAAIQQGRTSYLCDLIFKKTYQMLGGRLKLCISGGGPISADVQNFIRVVFRTNLIQGYGLTETCSTGTVQPYWSVDDSVVGPPLRSTAIRLNDCNEVLDRDGKPYLNTDRMHLGSNCLGRGEVWIRGPSVSSGYYMMEEKTREDFDADGWFHTGDIAIWTPTGMIKIVDRLKNLVKLKGGEYIAIESMEATYSQSVFVNGINGGIMCYGDGEMDRPVALVQVNNVELEKWATASGVSFASLEDLCKNEKAIEHVTKDLNAIGKPKLGRNELLASVALLPGSGPMDGTDVSCPWTPDNQYLTASNKLNRKPILKGFESIMTPLRNKGIR